ncbi:hypothetical protein [Azospirillum thermophilum]|uniref:Uncharacterized protein n=1 Tax=Azospirillum thermophilum TaxID=2202148 RepID=A0A2S2CPW0_9PROT|nr:hypothetical protein [Azospirillum thermophilum]AWK86410.1 hypothetical protein DEW08_09295 [Azospirillum thermophilum]
MIGNDLASMKNMLAGVFTKAAEAKEKAAGKTDKADAARPGSDARRAANATPMDPADPAVLLSSNLQDLSGRLRGMAEGASGRAQDGIARAGDALDQMQGMLEYNDAFADQLDQVMEAMGRDLGRMLSALGLGEEEAGEAVKGFAGRFGEDERRTATHLANASAGGTSALAAGSELHHERTAVAVELRNVELTLEQGGKTLTVSLDRSSLSMERTAETAFTSTDGRSTVAGAERSATSLRAESQGLTIRADGFSADELDAITRTLQTAMSAPPQGLEGGAVLTPKNAPREGEPLHLSLDLKALLTTAFGDKGAKAAESMGKDIRKQGFDVRI